MIGREWDLGTLEHLRHLVGDQELFTFLPLILWRAPTITRKPTHAQWKDCGTWFCFRIYIHSLFPQICKFYSISQLIRTFVPRVSLGNSWLVFLCFPLLWDWTGAFDCISKMNKTFPHQWRKQSAHSQLHKNEPKGVVVSHPISSVLSLKYQDQTCKCHPSKLEFSCYPPKMKRLLVELSQTKDICPLLVGRCPTVSIHV